ncbi:hypothetical protein J2T60_001499 [Natronospira proteinivora]|uniref:Nitrogen fixation protein FixH n=1 Tax=Natronospira proteinivora TaxID=1807133 RepID=A0ABT1G860_9GAMM|nr:FixH family protein [Natronospira proteinivora]MCP1727499.1 hypothetical protein [Natronospira proteinivora]
MKGLKKDDDHQPAWRQFWFWFVLAPPMASIVVGLSLVYTAVTQGDDKVVDDYYDAGRAIHREFDRERRAAELGLDAYLAVDREDGRITLRLAGADEPPEQLTLHLSHATHAGRDLALTLEADASGLYRGETGQPVYGRHYIRLEPLDQEWRINATLDIGDSQLDILTSERDQ